MDDKTQTSQNTEYAGPPKSHDFRDAKNVQQEPQQQQKEAPVKMTTTSSSATAEPNLLSMISAPDRVVPVVKKKKRQIKISLNWKDIYAYKHKIKEWFKEYSAFFSVLNIFWIVFKILFYITGIAFFTGCLFLYFQFESIVDVFLKEHNLKNITYERFDYSRKDDVLAITFENIQENTGLFQIDKMRANFSFSGLLDKKIQMVSFDGVKLFQYSKKDLSSNFKAFSNVLDDLGVFDNKNWFSIQSLRVENSKIFVSLGERRETINFSGVGSLDGKKEITFPISLEGKDVSLMANVKAEFVGSNVSWNIDVLSGSLLTLPIIERQNLSGQLSLKTSKGRVSSCTFSGKLLKDGLEKELDIELTNSQKDMYALKSKIVIKSDPEVSVKVDALNLSFGGNLESLSTQSQISLELSNFKEENFSFDRLDLKAVGQLNCNSQGCKYQLKKDTNLTIFSPFYRYQETDFNAEFFQIPLKSSSKNLFSFDDKNVNFDAIFGRVNLGIRKNKVVGGVSNLNINLKKGELVAEYIIKSKFLRGNFDSKIENIRDENISVIDGSIKAQFTGKTYNANLTAKEMLFLTMPHFKLPLSGKVRFNSDYYFIAELETPNKWMSLAVDGYYYPYTGEVIMDLRTNKPIVFSETSPKLSDISDLFSKEISNVKGSVNLKGELHYNNLRSISGPLSILLDNVSFDLGNMNFNGVTSVMNLTQIVPLASSGLQEIYVESIDTSLPFKNVLAEVIFDASKKQFNLSSLDVDIGKYHLRADPMWYGYDASSYMFSLKGKAVALQKIIDNTLLENLKISAVGNLSLSAEVLNNQFSLRLLELVVPSEGTIQYTPGKYINSELEALKNFNFRRLNVFLTQQGTSFNFVFSADNKTGSNKKKTSFRLTVPGALAKFIKSSDIKTEIPESVLKAKEAF